MNGKANRYVCLICVFLVFSVPAFVTHIILVGRGFIISPKLHFLFFVMHLISLVSIMITDYVKKGLVAYVYVIFLILKMGMMVVLVYKFPIIKQHIIIYFVFYWYYLILETFVVVMLLKNKIKFGTKTLSQ